MQTTAVVQIVFSERINPLSATDATFFVETVSDAVRVPGAADRLSATFTPTTALNPSIAYRVRPLSITDLAGQAITSFTSTFTTGTQ